MNMSIMVFPYKVTNRQIIYFVSKSQDLLGGPFSIFYCELSSLVGSFNIDGYVRQLWTVYSGYQDTIHFRLPQDEYEECNY